MNSVSVVKANFIKYSQYNCASLVSKVSFHFVAWFSRHASQLKITGAFH